LQQLLLELQAIKVQQLIKQLVYTATGGIAAALLAVTCEQQL
jgi:hypothetical protein